MGGLYAAFFAEAGHDVLALDVWQEHVDQINRVGLKVTGASGERIVEGVSASRVQAVTLLTLQTMICISSPPRGTVSKLQPAPLPV